VYVKNIDWHAQDADVLAAFEVRNQFQASVVLILSDLVTALVYNLFGLVIRLSTASVLQFSRLNLRF
jgi:hypothetical protein